MRKILKLIFYKFTLPRIRIRMKIFSAELTLTYCSLFYHFLQLLPVLHVGLLHGLRPGVQIQPGDRWAAVGRRRFRIWFRLNKSILTLAQRLRSGSRCCFLVSLWTCFRTAWAVCAKVGRSTFVFNNLIVWGAVRTHGWFPNRCPVQKFVYSVFI